MIYLSVEDYSRRADVSVQAVYKKIKCKQLKTVEKMQHGRLKKFIEVEEVEKDFQLYEDPIEQNNPLQNDETQNNYIEALQRIHEDYRRLVQANLELAELAGQTKLLTDSENRTRQEYFQLMQETKQVEQERAALIVRTQLLEKQNHEYSQVIQENKGIAREKFELKTKLEFSQQKLKELESKLEEQKYVKPKPKKKTIKQIIRDWLDN